jgi:uncharacterized protein YprB with RNaseH-like and TPR domain
MTKHVPVFFDIETTGLNPMAQHFWSQTEFAAQVTAVGLGTVDGWREDQSYEDAEYDVEVYIDSSEYSLLQKVNEMASAKVEDIRGRGNEPYLVGFNSRNFDHPYLGARFARLRLDGDVFNHTTKRLDMMRALGKHWAGVGRYPSEDKCLKALGIGSDDPYDGSDMPQAFDEGNFEAIITHVKADVEEMMKLFVELKEYCVQEYYDHYDIEADATFTETWTEG